MKYDEEAFKDLEIELVIEKNQLDIEALRQSSNYFHASEGYAAAVSQRDFCKLSLEQTEAELDATIRNEQLKDGEKRTEESIRKRIVCDNQYASLSKQLVKANYNVNRWKALADGFRQRGEMLKVLQQLYTSGYFG